MAVQMIRVRPARVRLVAFARWASAQTPKVRTSSPDAFAVPAHLVGEIPEELLVGAWVDGQRYVPAGPPPGAVELTGVGGPGQAEEREGTAGEPLPPAPESAYVADAVDLPEPDPEADGSGEEHACPHCPRTFGSRRGLNRHRQTHEG